MKKVLLAALFAAATTVAAVAQSTVWDLDKAHSGINFSVQHLVISEATGSFKTFEGTVTSTKPEFEDAAINFTIDVKSINTDNAQRDEHLKGADFFEADKYPTIAFKSKSLKKVSGKKYKLTGDLTMKGITKPVTFDVTYNGTVKDPWGNTKAGFKLTGVVNRKEFGLKWSTATEAGGAVVGDEVTVTANIELAKK